MKQPLILTLLMIVALSTATAQQPDSSMIAHIESPTGQPTDSAFAADLVSLTDKEIPSHLDTSSIAVVSNRLVIDRPESAETVNPTALNSASESDTETEPLIKIRKKTSQEDPAVATGQQGTKKKKARIRISLFKKPEGEEQTRRVLWRDGRWAGIGIHYSGLVTNLGNFSLPAGAERLTQNVKSIGVTLNPVDFILVGNHTVRLMTGLGFELNNFRFDQDVTLKYENGVTTVDEQYFAQGVNLTKSKLFTAYMNIPLLIEFQAGRNHNFFINGGVIGGLRIGAHTKIQGKGAIVGGTAKDHSSFGLRNFHYGYTINFGYSHIGFNLTYYHSPLWRKGAGPQARQVNAGISLVF